MAGNHVNATLNTLPVMLWVCDAAGKFVFFNQQYLRFIGNNLSDKVDGGPFKSIHNNDVDSFNLTLQNALINKLPFIVEYRLLRSDGIYCWFEVKANPVFNDDKFDGFIGTCYDITKFKLITENYQQTSQLLTKTNAMAKVGGWAFDVSSKELTWTDEIYSIHEVDKDFEPTVENTQNFYHPDDLAIITEAFDLLANQGILFDIELRLVTKNNRIKWVRVIGKPIIENGVVIRLIGALQDINDKKESALLLLESEKKLRFILNGLPVAVYLTNAEGYISDYNESAVDLWGQVPVINKDKGFSSVEVFDLFGNCLDYQQCPTAKAIAQNKLILGEELAIKMANGTKANVIVFATPYHNHLNQVQGAMCVMVDITDRKLIEERLSSLSHVARKTSNAVVITDADRNITWVNPSFTKITGYTSDEVVGKNPGTFLQFEKTDTYTVNKIREALNNGKSVRVELLNKGKNGNEFWIDMDIQPLVDANGVVVGFISVQADITEIKYMQNALRKSENKLRAILDSTSDLNILIDKDCRVLTYNKVASQIIKMLFDRTIGMGESIWDYPLNAEMRIEIKKNIDDALNGKSNKIETKIDAEGLSFWVELTYFPVYDNSGKLVGVALNGKDIDSNKRAELKVEQQNKKLLGIAFMQSHTLRRPIANIMGLCDLLCAEFKQEELNLMSINELMSLLVKSVSQTDNVIRNIVDSTKDIE